MQKKEFKKLVKQVETKKLTKKERAKAPGEFLDLGCGSTHYEMKQGTAPLKSEHPEDPNAKWPVVLVHGYSTPYFLYDHIFEGLVKEGYTVIRYDLIGRGLSERVKSKYAPEDFAVQLKELSSLLVDIHGQNDGRQLMDEKRHLSYLDRFGVSENLRQAYSAAYGRYRAVREQIEALRLDEEEKERLRDRLSYRIEELEKASLRKGEYEETAARLALLRNSEKLTEAIDNACALLYDGDENAVSLAQNAANFAQRAASYASELDESVKSINDAVFSLTDAAETLRDLRESLDFSPEEYDLLESRLALLNKLRRKYGVEEEGLITLLDESRRKLEEIESADEIVQKLERELEKEVRNCREKAAELSAERKKASEILQRRIVEELRDLSMPSVRFAVAFTPVENEEGFNAGGCDQVRFLMSANAGEELGRISHIASGGELSRIMLAMKNVFAENDTVSTMIFDEIDSGVSGIAAQRVGEKLYSVSRGKQVMCVTHLPQIAAMADTHFLIAKSEREGRTYTSVTPLDRQGRAEEIARLHGGDNITLLTIASAEEQLTACESFKKKYKA